MRVTIERSEAIPSWVLGALAALLGWRIGMAPPSPGLDPSWTAGLAIAVEEGLRFGPEIVFTYGPLGFLQNQYLWFSDLGVLAFLFSATVYTGFCIALVVALRRSLPALAAALVTFLVVAGLPFLEQPLLLAVLASLWLLERRRSDREQYLFAVGAASYAAVEALVKLSTGPVIAVVVVLAMIGAGARPRVIGAFLALLGVELLGLWLLTGQSLGAIPEFLANTAEIVSGYSSAMLRDLEEPAWKVAAATVAAALVAVALVAATAGGRFRDPRARWCGVALMAIAAFVVFKEGVVRTDAGHLSLFFSSACVLWMAIPWARRRWPALLAGAAAIALAGVPVRPTALPANFDALANLRSAAEQARLLVSPGRRADLIESGRQSMQAVYAIDPAMLAELRGHRVAVEPWEVGAAWAYGLEWSPLPVFQNYSAYTTALDRLNAEAVEDAGAGPDRILRENPLLVYPEFPTEGLDGRFPGWDPPAQARAVLCNFAPLLTDRRWQVLGRVPPRCGAARPAGTVAATAGEPVAVPAPGRDEVVFARVEGAEVSGLERLTTTLLHARLRTAVLDGDRRYRLLPETAADGLLLRGNPRLAAEQRPFAPFPQTRTIAVEGGGDDLRFEFFRMRVGAP